MTVARRWAMLARASVVLLVMALVPLLTAAPAHAVTTINVTTGNDVVNGADGVTSLREAINLANLVGGNAIIQLSASATLSKCDGVGDEDGNVGGDLDYSGAGPLTIRATAPGVVISGQTTCAVLDDRILDVHNASATLTIDSAIPGSPITLQHGAVAGTGGAIRSPGDVFVSNAVITANTATGRGAGIDGGGVSLIDTVVSSNASSGGDGGGVYTGALLITRSTISGNRANNGGGVYATAALTATASTFSGNVARTAGGGLTGTNQIFLTNSTVWGNSSVDVSTTGVHRGGGIDAPGTDVSLTFTTVGLNRGLTGGANIAAGGALIAHASVVGVADGQSTGSSCALGSTTSIGYDLDDGATCGFGAGPGDAGNVPNLLGPLGSNGGPTQTVSPQPGSPAVDRMPAADGACMGNDQRGVARPRGTGCDSGSFETNAPIVVTTTADIVNPGDGVLSLREAVSLANAQSGVDTIVLSPSTTYPISICGVETNNASGSLDARDFAGLTIVGSSSMIDDTCTDASDAVIQGGGLGLALEGVSVNHSPGVGIGFGITGFGGTVTLKDAQVLNSNDDGVAFQLPIRVNLVLQNAAIKNSRGQGVSSSGTGTLTMTDSEITGSQNIAHPGLLAGAGQVGPATIVNSSIHDNPGGGLWVGGKLTTTGSHFDHNTGGIPAVLADSIDATDSTFDNNVGTKLGAGGMLINGGVSSLTRVSISGNSASFSGGAIFVYGQFTAPTVTIADSHVDNNTMTGAGASSQDAGGIYVTSGGKVGGGVSITGSTVDGNHAPGWAAIYTEVPLTLTGSSVSGNTTTVAPPFTTTEATIFVNGHDANVTASTIANNVAPTTTAAGTGGIWVGLNTNSLTMTRSTVTGNTGRFGGVVMSNGTVTDSTIAGNSGVSVANLSTQGAVTVSRSVVGTPLGGGTNCFAFLSPIASGGHNFDSANACNFTAGTDIVNGGDPMLGALESNGGPTRTRAPQTGSPLVDTIPSGDPGCTGVDQRGVVRPQGPACDIGAVEVDGVDVDWAISAGGTGSDLARNVAVDSSGNSYVVGVLKGNATFGTGPSAVTLTLDGPTDGFVAKYAPDGTLAWAKRIGGPSSDEAFGVAIDPSGNPIVTGVFDGSVTFDSSTTLSGANDLFVAKYTPSGVLTWVRTATGPGLEKGLTASVDGAGNIFVGGVFTSPTATFGLGSGQSLTNAGNIDGFVARYGPNGGLWWVRAVAGPGQDLVIGVAARPDGSVGVAGTFDASTTFVTAGHTLNPVGGSDAFVGAVGPGGAAIWATVVGGAGSDIGWSVASGSTGDLYVTGGFAGTASIGGGPSAVASGTVDGFVAHLDAGGAGLWIRGFGGPVADYGLGVAVSGSDVYLTGAFMGSATFGPFALSSDGPAVDGFIARLGTDGSWVWAQSLVRGPGTDYGMSIAAGAGGAWAAGSFTGPAATVGSGAGALPVTGAGAEDVVIARFNR